MKKTFLYIFVCLFFFDSIYAEVVTFPNGESCVAWKTDKTLFVVNKQSPVGINCKIELKIEQTNLGYVFEGKFPISGFNSNQEMRDKEVRKILEEDIQPSLIFITNPISKVDWTKKKNSSFELKGILKKGKKDFILSFFIYKELQNGNLTWKGLAKTKFSELGMEAPKVAGGLITTVNDELELHFQFIETHINGFPK